MAEIKKSHCWKRQSVVALTVAEQCVANASPITRYRRWFRCFVMLGTGCIWRVLRSRDVDSKTTIASTQSLFIDGKMCARLSM